MSKRKNDSITFNDEYNLYYWTEYYGTTNDNEFVGTKYQPQTSFYRDAIGLFTSSDVPHMNKIRIASKVFGFIDGEENITVDEFENDAQPFRVFRLHEYMTLAENFRYKNPQRFLQLRNNKAFSQDGIAAGSPIIIDSLVAKPPDYVLSIGDKLTSQWNYDKLYGGKDFRQLPNIVGTASADKNFAEFQQEPFRLWSPFTYNFVDAFTNKMKMKIALSKSLPTLSGSLEPYTQYTNWFEEENANDLPNGNHLGKTLLPYTTSFVFTTGSVVPNSNSFFPYSLNTTHKGPVHIGLGHFSASSQNMQTTYHQATNGTETFLLDVLRDPGEDYFTNLGPSSTRNFVFETGSQPNLCDEWFWVYPNEHRFKNLVRQMSPKRIGDDSWGQHTNSGYSMQGWRIPENLTEKDAQNNINDLKLGTLFWKFDSGHMSNKYFGDPIVSFTTVGYLLGPNTAVSNFRYYGYKPEVYYTPGTISSPTIVMADFLGTPKGILYPGFAEVDSTLASQDTASFSANYQLYPKLRDMYTKTNLLLQFSLSFTQTYPKLNEIYKAFYGFGDGITTQVSEYNKLSSAYVSSIVDEETDATLGHRRKVTWGRDKVPSFKFGYQFLHTMTYSAVPLPSEENNVLFAAYNPIFPISNSVPVYATEPDVFVITGSATIQKETWPALPNYSLTSESPQWYEGPFVVAGPILRGFKYGLYDVVPKVPTSIYRRDRFGNFRDMLEQRKFYAVKFSDTGTELYPVTTQFVTGSVDEQIWKNYTEWQPGDDEPTNNSDAGLYELHNRTGKPFNDSGWV